MKQDKTAVSRENSIQKAGGAQGGTCFAPRVFVAALRDQFSARGILASFMALFLSACAGVCLLWAVYLLPTDAMDRHMLRSAEIMAEEGSIPYLYNWWLTSFRDNTTDSIMLMEAVNDSEMPPLKKAMLVPHGIFASSETDPNGKDDSIVDPVGRYILGLPFVGISTYPRYWHGYLLYIKPLLALTHYGNMRLLNGLLQIVLTALLFWRLARHGRRELILPWLLMYLLLMPLSIANCFQFSSCFYILLLASHACLSADRDRQRLAALFLYAGIATAYFDFLTYPAATFGVPAVLAVSLLSGERAEEKLAFLIRAGVRWVFGYAGMWAMKWLIGSVVTGENIFLDAWNMIRFRTSHVLISQLPAVSTASCLAKVVKSFFVSPFVIPFLLYCAVMLVLILRRGGTDAKTACALLLPFFLLVLLPFAWYICTVNHSYIHAFFTCRALSVSVLALMCGLAELCRGIRTRSDTQN